MIAPHHPLSSLERRPEFAGLLRENQQFATGSGKGIGESINGWFDRLMLQSGIHTSPMLWLGFCLLSALTFGGMSLVLLENPAPVMFLSAFGLLLPVGIAIVLRTRRQSAIVTQLPGMTDELARSARAGRNLEQSLMLVAGDTPAPLGNELKISARRMEMGLDVASSVRDLADRTGVSTLTIFSSALALHQDTGGDLIVVLERLGASVRDRQHFIARQQAATVSSRWAALMMISIPFIVLTIYSAWYPSYFETLTSSKAGQISFWGGVAGLLTGSLIVQRILGRTTRF